MRCVLFCVAFSAIEIALGDKPGETCTSSPVAPFSGGIAAAQRLVELRGGAQLGATNLYGRLLLGEKLALRVEDFKVTGTP